MRGQLENESSLGNGSRSTTLYQPQMRATKDTATIAGTVIGERWVPCPYEIIYVPNGLAVSRIGIPLPAYHSMEDLQHGLPYEHAEAIRWSYLAEAHAGLATWIKTRIREVRIQRSHTAVIGDCVPYECGHWRELYEAAQDGPASMLGPKPDDAAKSAALAKVEAA